MPFKALLTHLICLGDDEPQVTAYGLEEEADYYAPAFRFEDEDDNPWIPLSPDEWNTIARKSFTDARLRKEKKMQLIR